MNEWGESVLESGDGKNIAERRAEGARVVARYKELVQEREQKANRVLLEMKGVIKQSGHTIREVFGDDVEHGYEVLNVYSPEFIIETIQKLHGEKLPLKGIYLASTLLHREACKEFGSWPQAISAAGIGTVGTLYTEVDWINDKRIRDHLIKLLENSSVKWSEMEYVGAQLVEIKPNSFRDWYYKTLGPRTATWREDFMDLLQSIDKNVPVATKKKERSGTIELRPIPSLREIETALLELGIKPAAKKDEKPGHVAESTKTLFRLKQIASERLKELCVLQEKAAVMAEHEGFTLEQLFPKEFKNRSGKRSKIWTPEFIASTIKKLHNEGLPINSSAVQDHAIMSAAYREFGGWENAVRAAGIDYDRVRFNEKAPREGGFFQKQSRWSPERLTLEIQRRYRLHLPLNLKAVEKSDSRLISQAKKYYPQRSWYEALRTAGFDADEINLRGRGSRMKYPTYKVSLPRNWVSIHAPIGGEPELTLEGSRRIATEDTEAIAKVDVRLIIEAILRQGSLSREMNRQLRRYHEGQHLEDEEFEALTDAINQSPELDKLLKTQ
ncbi:hypothetical protein HY968_02385 [Candidatus Kaiserbacteria bacterium]|nr:hypothetical protein [Candidatus Kaiserbacteria bacterium]